MSYDFSKIEQQARTIWNSQDVYKVIEDKSKPKYYVLDMFPYPSGAGLHVGHPLGYIASDIVSRYKRQLGFNVLHPMGFDDFGLPAEQYAIQTGRHPKETTNENVIRYKEQLNKIGLSYDWSRQVRTSDPNFYKWTQWIYLELFNSWYNNLSQKVEPIWSLVNHFEAYGTDGLDAACTNDLSFADDEWDNYTVTKRQEVLMNYRLAYLDYSLVNWCPALGTVLANDEVKDGKSERGGHPVERKELKQWFLRITAYADRLLNGLDTVDWSESMKDQQRNWIGRSEGATVFFKTIDGDTDIEIFTTRPDTIFGATFMVLAPEHDLVQQITTDAQRAEVEQYLEYAGSRTDVERQQEKKVTGAFTGGYCLNPFTNKEIPIYISEYVLIGYGSGAIMAVPSDDDRDNAFANKYGIEIIEVIDKSEYPGSGREDKNGKMINSGFLNGMEVKEAISLTIERLEDMGLGKRKINFRLNDAGFSRQRYWGEPFPIIYKDDMPYPITEELPLELPDVKSYLPTEQGDPPLAGNTEWINSLNGRRESNTMPGYAGSSWYFFRYMDPNNNDEFCSEEKQNYWKNVDLYIGGTEHAVGHLLYSRFWTKFLHDIGKVTVDEPFKKLVNQGMIQGRSLLLKVKDREIHIPIYLANDKDQVSKSALQKLVAEDNRLNGVNLNDDISWEHSNGEQVVTLRAEIDKMSKRYLNVVNPDDIIEEYGADVFRMFEMFLGPIEQHKPWDTQGIEGVAKFMRRFWALFYKEDNWLVNNDEPTPEEYKILHKTIKKVGEDIERLSFNTAVSAFMIATNELTSAKCNKRKILEPLVRALSPFAPHAAENLWQDLGMSTSVVDATFPAFEEKYLVEDTYEYPISINGKMRTKISLPLTLVGDVMQETVLANDVVQKWVQGKAIRKFIHVPGRIVNIVV